MTAPAKQPPGPDLVQLSEAEELHAAAIHFLRSLKRFDADSSGLGPAALSALSVIYLRAPITVKELAAREGVKPPTITRIVASLAARGLVSKGTDAGDRRKVLLSLSDQGRDLFEAARQARLQAISAALGAGTSVEIRDIPLASNALARVAERLRAAE